MSTPTGSLLSTTYPAYVEATSAPAIINPDDPPWGVAAAAFVWVASVLVMFAMQITAVLAYILYRHNPAILQNIAKSPDPGIVFATIVSVIPAHLVTLAAIWAVVTQFGKRPFWQTLGWSWSPQVGFWTSAGIAVALLIVGGVITKFSGGAETDIDQIIKSSAAARITTALLATVTAPLVEEMTYRGVLYSALQRAIGALWAIIGVSTLFALIHAYQYRNNFGVITAVALLSFALTITRARTGRLLPCFVIHLVFNGLQAADIILEPYLQQLYTSGNHKTALLTLIIGLTG